MATDTEKPIDPILEFEDEGPPLEVPSGEALAALNRSEIDIQIATAKRWPRSLTAFKKSVLEMATLDEATAQGCYYTLSRGYGRDKKVFSGPSVRLAEIAVANWGNLRCGSRVIAIEDTMIVAQGACFDLEKNTAFTTEVRRGIMTSAKDGKEPRRYGNDMIIVTGNAACSIAFRNAAFKVIPQALLKDAYQGARRVVLGDLRTLAERRAGALNWYLSRGATPAMVFAWCGVRGEEEITLDHLADLYGLKTAIDDGEITVKEAMGDLEPEKPRARGKKLEEVAGAPAAPAAAPAAVPPAAETMADVASGVDAAAESLASSGAPSAAELAIQALDQLEDRAEIERVYNAAYQQATAAERGQLTKAFHAAVARTGPQ